MTSVGKWIAAPIALVAGITAGLGQDFPTRAVRILVPYSVGGTSDAASRLIVEPLGRHLGQSVFVENRGGAGGLNATEAFFNLPPDGYTLLVGAAGPFAIIPPTRPVSYAVERDVLPLGTIWRSPQLLAVNPKLGIKTMAEFIAHAKANPGKLTVGSAGVGALTHLSIELLKREARIDRHPCSVSQHRRDVAGADRRPDRCVVRGCRAARDLCTSRLDHRARHRRAAALAPVAGPRHHGGGGPARIESENWFGLVVSTKTPAPVAARLQAAMLAAQNDAAYRDSLAKQGVTAGEPGTESFAKLIRREIEKWKPIVTSSDVKIE